MLLVDAEGILQQLSLLLQVAGLVTGGNRGAGGTTGVQHVAAVVVLSRVQERLKTRLGVTPGTGVQRLFLAPDNVLGVGVAVQVLLELRPREGVELLNTGDGGVADALALTVLGQRGVHLTRAKDDTLDLLGLVNGGAVGRVGDDPLEVGVAGELLKRRAGNRVTQERLREEDHESYTEY